jgi:hypothetical protein
MSKSNNYTQSKTILDESQITLDDNNYTNALNTYTTDVEKVQNSRNAYLKRINPNNYLNKIVKFTDGTQAFVTNQGYVKKMTSGVTYKNINSGGIKILTIPWVESWTLGTIINTDPQLVIGTPMTSETQYIGNEGDNVWFNKFNIPTETYSGCYSDFSNVTNIGNTTYEDCKKTAVYQNKQYFGLQNYNSTSNTGVCSLSNTKPMTKSYTEDETPLWESNNIGNAVKAKLSSNGILQLYDTTDLIVYESVTPSHPNYMGCFQKNETMGIEGFGNMNFGSLGNMNFGSGFGSGFGGGFGSGFKLDFGSDFMKDLKFDFSNLYIPPPPDTTAADKLAADAKLAAENAAEVERKRIAAENAAEDERKRVAAEAEQKRIAAENAAEDERKRVASEAEQKRIAAENAAEDERKRIAAEKAEAAANKLAAEKAAKVEADRFNALNKSQQCDELSSGSSYYILDNTNKCIPMKNFDQSQNKISTQCSINKVPRGGIDSYSVYLRNDTKYSEQNQHFYLQVNDDNVSIYRGKPNAIQELVTTLYQTSKVLMYQDEWKKENGKGGTNILLPETLMRNNEWIGSPSGTLKMKFKNGKLVVVTNRQKCSEKKPKEFWGDDASVNAVYNLGVGVANNGAKFNTLSFIDADSKIYSYDNKDVEFDTTYSRLVGIQIPSITTSKTESDCKSTCDNSASCAGYSYSQTSNNCSNFEDTDIQKGVIISDVNYYTELKKKKPKTTRTNFGISNNVVEINSTKYTNYTVGTTYSQDKYGWEQPNVSSSDIDAEARKIVDKKYDKNASKVQNQYDANNNKYYEGFSTKDKIKELEEEKKRADNYNKIVNDSDIVVLQRNSSFLLWSILAVGTVVISMSVVRK